MEELFDVVDKWNNIVDQRPRAEVVAKKLLHRSVHVFVFDQKKLLFVHRRKDDREEHAGMWDGSCAGHVKAGEEYFAAAEREMKEELGLTLYPAFLRDFGASKKTSFEFVKLYCVEGVRHKDVTWTEEEFTDGQWLGLDEIERQMKKTKWSPSFVMMLRWYREVFERP
jgi:isopentenyl-diphosphate Delta-isomerase